MASELFKSYYNRLAREGFLKALLCGLVIGFSALFLTAAFFWMFGVKQVWIVAIVFAVAVGVATPLFYYKRFKPTTKKIAERVDALGLEERLLTMTELEGDTSYIAMRQREDALAALKTVHAGLVPLAISSSLIVAVAVSAAFGAGMTTISVLAANGDLQSGIDIVNPPEDNTPKWFDVVYEIEEGEGQIIGGDPFQSVLEGEDASPVYAAADDGWAFLEWSDGSQDPYRQDLKIKGNMTIYAKFGPAMGNSSDGDSDGDGDQPSDQPSDGEGNGNSNNNSGPGSGAGGTASANNQIIDGKTFFEDAIYDNALDDAIDDMNSGNKYTSEDKDMIGGYFDSIKQ